MRDGSSSMDVAAARPEALGPLGEPALRDTTDCHIAVKGAVPPARVKVRPPHERLLAMR